MRERERERARAIELGGSWGESKSMSMRTASCIRQAGRRPPEHEMRALVKSQRK